MTAKTERGANRGAPKDEKPAPRPPSRSDQIEEARQEVKLRAAELDRARTRRNTRRSSRRQLQRELSGLPEYAEAKLTELHLGSLRTAVDDWLRGLAGPSGDPTEPPIGAGVLYLLDSQEAKFKAWLSDRLDVLAADSTDMTFSGRSRKEIEADLTKIDKQITEAETEVEAAERANVSAIREAARLNNGRMPR